MFNASNVANYSAPVRLEARKRPGNGGLMIIPMRTIRIIVVDDAQRDVCAFRDIWRKRAVELVGPFPTGVMTGDTVRRSDGVLIALDTDITGLQNLLNLLKIEQVPFLFTVQGVSGVSNVHFTLDADVTAIDEMLEELVMQDDDGIRH